MMMITKDNKEEPISTGSVIEKNKETSRVQYWWLNISSETWDIEEGKIGDKKTIAFINDISCPLDEETDIEFVNWLDRYLVDREDNPHFGRPIAKRELAISWLDFRGKEVNKSSIRKALKDFNERIRKCLPPCYVFTPAIVLKSKSDREDGSRACLAWQHTLNSDGSIRTDKEGNRFPRKRENTRCYYFYRKDDVPIHYPDKKHIGDKNYVQPAPEEDLDIGFDIKSVKISNRTSSIDFHNGDFVVVCEIATKLLTGLLKIVNVKDDKVTLQIMKIFNEPVPIEKCDGKDYISEDFDRLIPLDNKEYKNIEKEIVLYNPELCNEDYSKEKLLKEAFINECMWNDIDKTLSEKKCIILQGAPGVGKTYLAKRIAYARMGMKDDSRIEFVQFHPNYTYEDFVIGYKPKEESPKSEEKKKDGGFTLRDGIFKEFCKEASQPSNSKKDFYFIIDEINRGNVSKIFGEAFSLIEKDYRNQRIRLAYSQKYFKIPKNVYIIGLMNTADRSLAMIDFALRRRFRFITIDPAFLSDSFKKFQKEVNNKTFDKVIKCIVDLNEIIKKDHSLGEGFYIGHSYFCNKEFAKNDECLRRVIEYEIIPMLQEYWFDNENKFKEQAQKLRNSLK